MKKELKIYATEVIGEFEGFREYSYKDNGGIWTIGYGQTYYDDGRKVGEFHKITKQEAKLFLQKKVEKIYYFIVKKVNRALSDNQYCALISLVYNIGETAFARSTLLRCINLNKEKWEIKKEWLRWSYVKGVFIKGLRNRRIKETNIYFPEKNGEFNFEHTR